MVHKIVLQASAACLLLAATQAVAETKIANIVGRPDAASKVGFDVVLPLRNTARLDELLTALHDPSSSSYHRWLTPAEFGKEFGPDEATISRVAGALQARGFSVTRHTRSLHVSGPARAVEETFGTHLALARGISSGKPHIVADSVLKMPAELDAAGAFVISFSGREAHTMSRVVTGALPADPKNRSSNIGGYWFDDLKQAYGYPSYQTVVTVGKKKQRLDGTGATIGVLMSSDVLDSDIKAVFDHENWTKTTKTADPTLFQRVTIDGGGGVTGGAFGEASLDVQEELTGAPGAHVVLYNIPSLSDGDIFNGYVTAIESNAVDLLSSSFGGCELAYFASYNGGQDYTGVLRAYHELFVQGNTQGITFLASSGDEAGRECPNAGYFTGAPKPTFVPSVSFPADDPNVTAVGGTNVVTTYLPGSLDSSYAGENSWSDPEIPYDPYGLGDVSGGFWGAGGGYSSLWPAPKYQSLVKTGSTKFRAVPDIGMQVGGCPSGLSVLDQLNQCDGGNLVKDGDGNTDRSYVAVALDGQFYGLIGTSVASPELAGALALLIETKGRQGNINNLIYSLAAAQAKKGVNNTTFHTGIPGYNGVRQANVSATFNVTTGVGTPIIRSLIGLPTSALAGIPQTASNP